MLPARTPSPTDSPAPLHRHCASKVRWYHNRPVSLIVLLFTIGILLLAIEVILPGGILGVAGGLLLFAASIVSFVRLGVLEGLLAILASLVVAALVFYLQFKFLPKTRMGKKFFLTRQIDSSSTSLPDSARDLIGKRARSVTLLSPSGYINVGDVRYEAFSDSGQIPAGTELLITDANHFQLTVRPLT